MPPRGGGAAPGRPPFSPPLVLHPRAEGMASTFSPALPPASVPWALHNQRAFPEPVQRTGLLHVTSAAARLTEGFWR